MRISLAILFLGFLASLPVKSQDPLIQKIGFADTDYILSHLPEFKKIESELKTHASQLENQLKLKYEDYQAKLKIYQGLLPSAPEAVRADKEGELASLQQGMDKFKQEAQLSYQKKQSELLEPIQLKIGKVIEDIAKENGYSFILGPEIPNTGIILLYKDERFNISDLVLKKLGVTVTPPSPTKTN
jgi:outer membrane protein